MYTISPMDKKIESKKRTVKDLADYIRTRSGNSPNYCLFLGAGASVTSGIRTAVELVNDWRKEIFLRLSDEGFDSDEQSKKWLENNHGDWYNPLNEYSSLFEKKFDLPSQRRRFVELQVDKKLPSIGYAYLVELFEAQCFDTIFTTNFDDLINEAFYQFSAERPLLCAHDSSVKGISITSSRPKIIKLHGDYLYDSIRSSLNETESLEINTKEKLIEFTKEYGLIFVGYAGNDNSIMEVIKSLLKQDDYLKNGVYWCKRKSDPLTAELIRFINNERVYLVEIDGFDELMAELCCEMGQKLSLGGLQKSTKRERIISKFLEDDYSLNENKFIHDDLVTLKKHTFTQDISSLINELSDEESTDHRIPETDFRNLLLLDDLLKNKSYDQAETEIEKLLLLNPNDNMREKYLQRLIMVFESKGDLKKALEYNEKLIGLDEYNIPHNLSRTDFFSNTLEKVSYLKTLLSKFPFSINLKNELSRFSIKLLNESTNQNLVSYADIEKWLECSIKHDCSLDNRAWSIKYDSINYEHSNSIEKKERNEKIDNLLKTMKDINPSHGNYLNLEASSACESSDLNKIKSCITIHNDVYEKSPRSKRKYILKNLCKLHLGIFETEKSTESKMLMDNFISKYDNGKDEVNIAPFLIFKARHAIGYNRDISSGIELAKQSLDKPLRNNEVEKICDIILIDKNNIDFTLEFLDSLPNEEHKITIEKITSDILLSQGHYLEALKHLDAAHNKGWSFTEYLMSKVYLFLKEGKYTEAIHLVDDNLHKVKDYRDKDVLIINREVAKQKNSMNLKESDIRSVIAHQQSKGQIAMCGFFLLNDEHNAKRQLKSIIDKDYMNYFRMKNWPALPQGALSSYELTIIAA